jgi:flagellar hook-associated protein 2
MPIGPVSFGGLASGIDTQALIEAILKAERKPAERLQARQALLEQRRAAFGQMRTKLSAFADAVRSLSSEVTFRGRTSTVGDETRLRATPGAGAETGIFTVEVVALAAAHKLAGAGLASPDQGLVSDGTLTLQAGDEEAITIEVSAAAGNNTLERVRDAINDADAGVVAAVIFDGATHHLVVRAEQTGTANALSVTDGTNLNLDDPGALTTAAADAQLVVDGIDVTSSSNRVSGVLPGTTLDLLQAEAGTEVTVEVRANTEAAAEAVQSLVTAYNEAIGFFVEQFDRESPGPLSGESSARQIQQALQSLVTGGVAGLPAGGLRALSSLGVSFSGTTGKMTLDAAALDELLEERGDEVARVFLAAGTASDPRISYFSSSGGTLAGEYAVELTTAAEQASVVGSTAVSGAGLNADETLTVAVGPETTTIELAAGMTLAQVVDALNAAFVLDGTGATASADGGRLRVTARDFGSATTVSVGSSLADPADGTQSGFDLVAASDAGVDVAGTIGGVAATGAGRLLTGADGGDWAGLVLEVGASAADIAAQAGDFGTISFSRGLVRALLSQIDEYTAFGEGPIHGAQESIDATLERLADDIQRIEDRLQRREAFLVRVFGEAERAIAALQAQQSQLAGVR